MALIDIDCIEDAGNYNIFGESRNIVSEAALRVISKILDSFSIFMNLQLHLVRFPKNTLRPDRNLGTVHTGFKCASKVNACSNSQCFIELNQQQIYALCYGKHHKTEKKGRQKWKCENHGLKIYISHITLGKFQCTCLKSTMLCQTLLRTEQTQ